MLGPHTQRQYTFTDNVYSYCPPCHGVKISLFYFQQYKKRAKAKGKKKCHTETMKGRKSRYNLYIREPLMFCFGVKIGLLFFKKTNPSLVQKWWRGMTKRTRERGEKAKRAGLSQMMRVENLWVTSTSTGVKSTVIHTSVNIFETSKRDKPQYFVDKVKDKRRTKNNNLEFLMGWHGFPDPKDDTWEPIGHLSGSEHMIREFNEQWEKRMLRATISTWELTTRTLLDSVHLH